MKGFAKALIGVLGVWVLLLTLVPRQNSLTGAIFVTTLKIATESLQGQELTQEEIENYISHMELRWELNSYKAKVTYHSPSDWSVTLTPENRSTFANQTSLIRRIFLLELDRTKYPDLHADSSKAKSPIG